MAEIIGSSPHQISPAKSKNGWKRSEKDLFPLCRWISPAQLRASQRNTGQHEAPPPPPVIGFEHLNGNGRGLISLEDEFHYCGSCGSWVSLKYPKIAIYVDTLKDCYEPFVLYNFMILLMNYLQIQFPNVRVYLETKEMSIVAVALHYSFTYKLFMNEEEKASCINSFLDMLDFSDIKSDISDQMRRVSK
ncbi:hypothetical protein ACRRTK_009565 [Alexandromys fortis]